MAFVLSSSVAVYFVTKYLFQCKTYLGMFHSVDQFSLGISKMSPVRGTALYRLYRLFVMVVVVAHSVQRLPEGWKTEGSEFETR
jgi:hypothetical protein